MNGIRASLRLVLLPVLIAPLGCDSEKEASAKAAPTESAKEKAAPKAAPAEPAPAAAPEAPKEEAPAVEVSDAMKAFMSELGEHDAVTAALAKHGTEGLEADMGMYNISEPQVTAANPGAEGETCYAMQAKTGMVQRKFEICWKGDKITRADNKGLAQ